MNPLIKWMTDQEQAQLAMVHEIESLRRLLEDARSGIAILRSEVEQLKGRLAAVDKDTLPIKNWGGALR